MLIGIDLDNTIINYENVFKSLLEKKDKSTKNSYKNTLKKKLQSISQKKWTETQGEIYGKHINRAKLSNHFLKFLRFINGYDNIKIVIVSHKTKYPIIGKKYNLHASAINFLNDKIKFFKFKMNKNIFFEKTLNKKLNRIRTLDCDLFIDDLEKVLKHKNFPEFTEKIYFSENNQNQKKNWGDIIKFIKKKFKVNKEYKNNNNHIFIINNQKKILVKKFRTKNYFSKELRFYDFLKEKNIKNAPRILNISSKRKVIKFDFVKKNISMKNEELISKNIKFIKDINSFKNDKIKFNYAKDFTNSGSSYLKELKNRLQNAKLKFKIINKKKNKFIIEYLEKKISYLNKIKYFNKFEKLKRNEIVISPCDFHRRNMILNSERIYYIDFEYSGFDDLAKLFSVYFLQPELNINTYFFNRFDKKIKKSFPKNSNIIHRIKYLFPIIYLRWCLILINKINKKKPLLENRYQIDKILLYIRSRKDYFKFYKEFI